MMQAAVGSLARGRFVLIPISDQTRGHGTHSLPLVFGPYLTQFLASIAH